MRNHGKFRRHLNLYEARSHASLRVLLISGNWEERRSFNQLGLFEGSKVRVLHTAPFGGPMLIQSEGTRVAIGKQLAEMIGVEILK
jgi:ferrous iron transport protein A